MDKRPKNCFDLTFISTGSPFDPIQSHQLLTNSDLGINSPKVVVWLLAFRRSSVVNNSSFTGAKEKIESVSYITSISPLKLLFCQHYVQTMGMEDEPWPACEGPQVPLVAPDPGSGFLLGSSWTTHRFDCSPQTHLSSVASNCHKHMAYRVIAALKAPSMLLWRLRRKN